MKPVTDLFHSRGCRLLLFTLLSPLLTAAETPAPTAFDTPPPAALEATTEKQPAALDSIRDKLASSIGNSARWIDGFFGENRFSVNDEKARASGRLYVRALWHENLGVKVRSRLRVNLPLHNFNQRIKAVVGKGDTDQIIEDKDPNATLQPNPGNNDWLLGLGYVPEWSESGRFSFHAGVVATWPLDPYVRVNYAYQHDFGDKLLLRLNEGLFWKRSERFGLTTALDLDWTLSKDVVVRWPNWTKISDITEGFEYDSRIMVYHNLGDSRALVYAAGLQGQSGAVVPVRQYGAYIVCRQQMFREWFSGELIVGASMLRELTWTKRKFSPAIGLGFEIAFDEGKSSRRNASFTDRMFWRRE